jgi:hypothetical protein
MHEGGSFRRSGPTYLYLAGLMAYGWSFEGLVNSRTKLMQALKPTICCALQMFSAQLALDTSVHWRSQCSDCSAYHEKRKQGDGSGDSDSQSKRRRLDGPGTSERFSPARSDFDPAVPSHPIPLGTSSREEYNERGSSNLSQLDALAVAAAQAGLFEDYVVDTDPLPLNPPYSQQSFIHPRSSSSMAGGMVNYDGTAAKSSLSTTVDNSSQGGLDARISVGQGGLHLMDARDSDGRPCEAFRPDLHLWIGHDVAGGVCEELFYMKHLDLNLWEAQDLPSGPFELLESDFDLGDGQTL